MTAQNFAKLIVSIAISELAGVIGAFFTTPAIASGWYAALARPAFSPPSWVFGPVWVTLYALMGIAAFLVWRRGEIAASPRQQFLENEGGASRNDRRTALGIFGVQLFLNALWSIIFFGLRSPGWALVDIVALWLAIVLTIVAFARLSKPAAWLLVPYILWVSFAMYLNYAIWALN